MKKAKIYLSLILFLQLALVKANSAASLEPDLDSPPPRIIRVCCAFGADLGLFGIPFFKINHITSMEQLNGHKYMGDKEEGNGVIYTKKGGFIDIGHLRDQADWTNYLYSLILNNRINGAFIKKLGKEGGSKTLYLDTNSDLDSIDCLLLAGKIAFDLSLWHELSTWFGASEIPMMPERYSSFSVEDVYSNLLGVHIGIEALQSKLPYNEAMTTILYKTLDSLGAVGTEAETYQALEAVRNVWWTNEKRLPSSKVIIERDTEVSDYSRPWLIPDSTFGHFEPHILYIPRTSSKGLLLTNYYDLKIDLNYKFPVKEMFPERETRLITQDDFRLMLERVSQDLQKQQPSKYTNTETLQPKEQKNSF